MFNTNTTKNYSDTWQLCQSALQHVCPIERETWLRVAMALKTEFGDLARDMWELWSQQADNYDASAANSVWRGIRRGQVGIASLFYMAQQNGWSHKDVNTHSLSPKQQFENAQRIEAIRKQEADAQQKRYDKNAKLLRQVWESSYCLDGYGAASRYLANRGLLAPSTQALRWHDAVPYYHEGKLLGYYPTLLAAVTSREGELVAIHRTYLTEQGTKADVPIVKKLMSTCGSMSGASIKLHHPRKHKCELSLGIAEGIETALAAQSLFGISTWPCISTSGLVSFVPDFAIRNIYIFGDNDANQAGQDAAYKAAERLTRIGFTVRVHIPEKVNTDWADVLMGGASHE